jgi:hypothetical protein
MQRAFSTLTLSLAALGAATVLSLGQISSSLAAGRSSRAHAAGVCKLAGQEEKLGPTYVTYIGVGGGATCHQAFTLIRSYYRCRIKHGGVTGYCGGVEGFRCSEHRFAKIKVQFDASVTCTRGREIVKHNYTQFT